MKKRGLGEGKWNGFGGKVIEGESLEQAARRELFEEAGIAARSVELAGEILFRFPPKDLELETYIFKVADWKGEPEESEEMRPQWFPRDALPFEAMWPDDRLWMPFYLEGRKFRGKIFYDDDGVMIHHAIAPVA